MKKILSMFIVLGMMVPLLLAQHQTGSLLVSVRTGEEQLLPGVTVTISSNVLMGKRTRITGSNGKVVFRDLPPGPYRVVAEIQGFQTFIGEDYRVSILRTVPVDIVLKLGETSDSVSVIAANPIVDSRSNTVQAEFDFDVYINHLPSGRHFTAVMGLSGGVEGAGNPFVLGSASTDNMYLVDGVNTTDSRTQTWGGQFNVDAIADMSVMKGGVPAEFGHFMGGVLNVVTKSGSNELHGMIRYEMRRILWNDLSEKNPAAKGDDVREGVDDDSWNYSAGGPIWPDVLWWYFSYTPQTAVRTFDRYPDPGNPEYTELAYCPYIGHLLSVKGSLQATQDIKLSVFYKEDPVDIPNIWGYSYFDGHMQADADATQEQGGGSIVSTASWVISNESFITLRYTADNGYLNEVANDADSDYSITASRTTGPTFIDINWFWIWGCYYNEYFSDRNHWSVAGDVTYLLETESIGSHDIKAGVEYLDNYYETQDIYYPGGGFIQTGNPEDYGNFDATPWYYFYYRVNNHPMPVTKVSVKHLTWFIQDSLQLTDDITLNIGFREDTSAAENNQGTELWKNGFLSCIAPRLGFAYDLDGSSIHGSFSRYYDTYSLYLLDPFIAVDDPELIHGLEPIDGVDGRNGWDYANPVSIIINGDPNYTHTVSSDLTPQYTDEITLGFDYLVSNNISAAMSFVYRVYRDLVTLQDIDDDYVFNVENVETDAYGSKYKEFAALMFDFNKRPADDNLFVSMNFTYHLLYEGLTGGADYRGDSLTGGYLNFGVETRSNAESWWHDSGAYRWVGKLQATYFLPNGWYIGTNMTLQDGIHETTYRYTARKAFAGRLYIAPNGWQDLERLPAWFDVDLQAGFEDTIELPWDLPIFDDSIMFGIYFNIYNILNDQTETSLNHTFGSTSHGLPDAWRPARNYLLGLRLEF